MDIISLGKRLQRRRTTILKRSLDQLAATSGLTKGHLSMIERGKIDKPSMETLSRVAAAYNVDIAMLTDVFYRHNHDMSEQIKLYVIIKQIQSDEKLAIGDYVAAALKEHPGEHTMRLIVKLYERIYKRRLL